MRRTFVALILLLNIGVSRAASPIKLKSVTLDEFMHNQLNVSIKLPIPVPATYKWASLANAPVSYSYWMRAQDILTANSTNDLPSEHGYMYGKITTNVGYDPKSKVFMGANDPVTLEKIKEVFPHVNMEHLMFGKYPVLLMSASVPDSGKYVYSMYVAIGVSSNVVYVAFRPPNNSKAIGDYVWGELKKGLSQ